MIWWLLAWGYFPMIVLLTRPAPWHTLLVAGGSMMGAMVRCLPIALASAAAPFVVPVALAFTPREANALPWLFRWWDNDVSINGDQAEGAETYYAPHHDRRSFWARYVWLGLRNRASWLAVALGHTYAPGEYDDFQSWGDVLTERNHEGWVINRRGMVWQMYVIKRIGGWCLRIHVGHKVWAGLGDGRGIAMVVWIPITVVPWEGA